MYIVIYKDGDQGDKALTVYDLQAAVVLPGEKYIFSWFGQKTNNSIENHDLYSPKGICSHNPSNPNEQLVFTHKNYALVKIVHLSSSSSYQFWFRDEQSNGDIVKITVKDYTFPNALQKAVKEIIIASKFDSWAEYQRNVGTRHEVERLHAEIAVLKKEKEELLQKITELTKSQPV